MKVFCEKHIRVPWSRKAGVEEVPHMEETKGLYIKYDVRKIETGETVNNCFVLRPDKDPAAAAAFWTYARVTPNKTLANDIMAWIGANTADKPQLAEILGVEMGQKFRIDGFNGDRGEDIFFEITDNGFDYEPKGVAEIGHAYALIDAINHPEKIIRLSRLTESEIAIMRDMGAMWVSRDTEGHIRADLWDVKPFKTSNKIYVAYGIDPIARVKVELFPSVKPGDCICLEEWFHEQGDS